MFMQNFNGIITSLSTVQIEKEKQKFMPIDKNSLNFLGGASGYTSAL